MSLIPVDAEYHYVQDTAPNSANPGDVWLDTSVNPPVSKIYADVGSGLEWLQDQSSDRIANNLDAPVSQAGQGVDWATKTFDSQTFYEGPKTVSGSGYILQISAFGTNVPEPEFKIDGTSHVIGGRAVYTGADFYLKFDGPIRFDSSFELNNNGIGGTEFSVNYVLD